MRCGFLAVLTAAAVLAVAPAAGAGTVEDCEQNGDPGLGVGACTAVIQSGQYSGAELAWVHYNRANAFNALGEHARAIEDYDRTLALDPGFAYAYTNRGVAYRFLGQNERAIEDFDQALKLNPKDSGAYQSRGAAWEALGANGKAVSDWEKAIMLDGAGRARWWQEYMAGKGHYHGPADGIYGPGTRKALEACAADPDC